MANDATKYSALVFFKAALPLMKPIAEDVLADKFKGVNAVYQISAKDGDKEEGIHFIIENGVWNIKQGLYDGKIDAGMKFSNLEKFAAFMKGDMLKLPKFIIGDLGKFIKFMMVLLKMSSLLTTAEPPKDEKECLLITKLYFRLLSYGISALNKAGEPTISKWIQGSPDRVYQWEVENHPELTCHLRINKGKSQAVIGAYERANPFFTMKFDSGYNALQILLETGSMFDLTANGNLKLIGGPEFGVQLGDAMGAVGGYAK